MKLIKEIGLNMKKLKIDLLSTPPTQNEIDEFKNKKYLRATAIDLTLIVVSVAIYLQSSGNVLILIVMACLLWLLLLEQICTFHELKYLSEGSEQFKDFVKLAKDENNETLKIYAASISEMGRMPILAEYEAFAEWISKNSYREALEEFQNLPNKKT